MLRNLIIAVPYECSSSSSPAVFEEIDLIGFQEFEKGRRLFTIRSAHRETHRSSAKALVNRMFIRRGYISATRTVSEYPHRLTLIAEDHGETIGTLTVGFDGPHGLFVDDLFAEEVESIRREGRKVCEFTKLAVDASVASKRVLASLFHVAYMCAYRLRNCDTLFIQVNPRHVKYYEVMLGFRVMGVEKLNRRVNAPATLMCVGLAHIEEGIACFGGLQSSIFPHCFSAAEESNILARVNGCAALADA